MEFAYELKSRVLCYSLSVNRRIDIKFMCDFLEYHKTCIKNISECAIKIKEDVFHKVGVFFCIVAYLFVHGIASLALAMTWGKHGIASSEWSRDSQWREKGALDCGESLQ